MKSFLMFALLSLSVTAQARSLAVATQSKASLCVNVYYDKGPDASYWMGKTYATLVQNLLGHFPEFQQIVSPIEAYQQGDLDKCQANIYIGSYFNSPIPAAFFADHAKTTSNVAWMGYNIWKLGETFESKFGYRYSHLSQMDKTNVDDKGRPSFLKNVYYKGEMFFKYGDWSKTTDGLFLAPFEQAILTKVSQAPAETVAYAQNPVTGEEAPYILRKKNHFYVADVPLSFMHEADRYMIFADVLFDILNAKPRHNGKYAFLRIEDIHPLVPLSWLYSTSNTLKENKVPLNVSLIPIFYDPLKQYTRGEHEEIVTMDRHRGFMSWIADVKKDNANFIWHGVTHQYKQTFNPHSGVSGDDFEFFDAVNNKPIAEDSPRYVLNKLEDGFEILKKADIFPRIWLMPHYQASPLDYIIFGEVFPWNVGRVIYYNFTAKGVNQSQLNKVAGQDDSRLWFSTNSVEGTKLRSDVFANLQVQYQAPVWSGQMFPYEIYGDVHGQRLIPENLGNSQPFVNEHVTSPRTKEDIVADAKRNLVLRDAWASFFYHPFLLVSYEEGGRGTYPGDASELVYIISELKKMGYQFIDINKFMDKNTKAKRFEPVYKDEQ